MFGSGRQGSIRLFGSSAPSGRPVPTVREDTPLLQSPGIHVLEDDGPTEPLREMKAESLKERAVAATAAVSFAMSLLSMIFETTLQHPSIWISNLLGCILSPYAAFQQSKLTQVEALRQTNATLEREVSDLTKINENLKSSVQNLEEHVINLQAMEETLETLQSMKGRSLESLQEELAESREIASQMKLNARSQVLQLLISVMLNCDNDGDLILSDAEIDSLIENTEAINGVQVNEDLLRDEIIKHGRSLVAVMEVTRNLIMSGQKRGEDKGTPPSNQSIFRFLESSEESEH